MAWYKIDIMYGPGHQGTRVQYEWREGEVTKEDEREMFDDIVHGLYTYNASGKVDLVTELPEDVKANKIKNYRQRIESAKYMLKILGV